MRITKNNNSSIYYVIKDHIGSVNTLVTANGNVAQESYFDAWGYRRDTRTFEPLTTTFDGLISYGYTGHDHWDSFGLIYMKGRVYEPALGRFLNPDNYVQNSSDLQSYNRYTYCNNNPLKYTDPSGEFIFGSLLFGGLGFGVGMILDYTITKYLVTTQITGQERSWSGLGVAFATDAITVATGGVASFGFQPIGFIAGASFGAYTGFVSAFAGGFTNSVLQGNSFKDAVKAGGNAGLIGAAGGAIIGGVAGGIKARKMGFDFWEGTGNGKIIQLKASSYNPQDIGSPTGIKGSQQLSDHTFKFYKDSDEYVQGVFEGIESNSNPFRRIGYTVENNQLFNELGEPIHGACSPFKESIFGNVKSYITVSPNMVTFSNNLHAVLGHEITHAFHYYTGFFYRYGEDVSEYYALKFSASVPHNTQFGAAAACQNLSLDCGFLHYFVYPECIPMF